MNKQHEMKLIADMHALFAKMYHLQLSERTRQGIKAKKERSLHVKKSKV